MFGGTGKIKRRGKKRWRWRCEEPTMMDEEIRARELEEVVEMDVGGNM